MSDDRLDDLIEELNTEADAIGIGSGAPTARLLRRAAVEVERLRVADTAATRAIERFLAHEQAYCTRHGWITRADAHWWPDFHCFVHNDCGDSVVFQAAAAALQEPHDG